MECNDGLSEAGAFMGRTIERFAALHPEYTEPGMRGWLFWVVTCYFPEILAELQVRLTRLARQMYLLQDPDADLIAWVRMELVKLTTVGDLGENHTKMYQADHPELRDLSVARAESSPFAYFCRGMIAIEDVIALLGALTRNEEGSVREAEAMVHTGLIADAEFARVHLEEEPEHATISASIRERMLAHPRFCDRFLEGLRIHDRLYSTMLE